MKGKELKVIDLDKITKKLLKIDGWIEIPLEKNTSYVTTGMEVDFKDLYFSVDKIEVLGGIVYFYVQDKIVAQSEVTHIDEAFIRYTRSEKYIFTVY